jgi:hypothetical protein
VTVANNSSDAARSTDGITWTPQSLPFYANWCSVTVDSTTGIFVAVTYDAASGASSTDGIAWTPVGLPFYSNWWSVTVNPTTGIFVAIVQGTNQAASSTDGTLWTARTLPSFETWNSVTVNPTTGIFVAVSQTSDGARSTDGISWTGITLPFGDYPSVTGATVQVSSTVVTNGSLGLGIANSLYHLDLSTDGARKLTTTTWITGSDSRIKTDIESANLQTCYETVKSVDLKYFKWNFPEGIVPDDKHSLGFIAQEVKEVFPNAVSESNSYGYSDFLSLNTDQILKALFGAVKYLAAKVEVLEQSQSP